MFIGIKSPTHKRTEGRSPVWGSEFTSKGAALQGDLAEIAPTLNVKQRDSVVVTDLLWRATPFLEQPSPIIFLDLFGPSRTISNLCPKNLSRDF